MNLTSIYQCLPTRGDCIRFLEDIRWHCEPECPYCHLKNATVISDELRYHCNSCNTSYSVTVRTIFHRTRLDLQKWFLAIFLIYEPNKPQISGRQLATMISVNKDTANHLINSIYQRRIEERILLADIVKGLRKYIDIDNSIGEHL